MPNLTDNTDEIARLRAGAEADLKHADVLEAWGKQRRENPALPLKPVNEPFLADLKQVLDFIEVIEEEPRKWERREKGEPSPAREVYVFILATLQRLGYTIPASPWPTRE